MTLVLVNIYMNELIFFINFYRCQIGLQKGLRQDLNRFVVTQSLWHKQDVTQGQSLSGLQLVWIQNFSSRMVA